MRLYYKNSDLRDRGVDIDALPARSFTRTGGSPPTPAKQPEQTGYALAGYRFLTLQVAVAVSGIREPAR